ncbi:MAG: thioredoxin [Myxococcota bacterium]
MAEILDVTDADFEQKVLQSETPVLVDFWAEWCAPCRALSPVIKELAGEYEGRLRVAKVDVDANPTTAQKFGIRAMPTLLFIKDGRVTNSVVGAQPKRKLSEHIDRLLGD